MSTPDSIIQVMVTRYETGDTALWEDVQEDICLLDDGQLVDDYKVFYPLEDLKKPDANQEKFTPSDDIKFTAPVWHFGIRTLGASNDRNVSSGLDYLIQEIGEVETVEQLLPDLYKDIVAEFAERNAKLGGITHKISPAKHFNFLALTDFWSMWQGEDYESGVDYLGRFTLQQLYNSIGAKNAENKTVERINQSGAKGGA